MAIILAGPGDLVDPADFGIGGRPGCQAVGKAVEGGRITLGLNVYLAGREVADKAADPELLGQLVGGPAEPDPLHPTANCDSIVKHE